ncbi:hypothetical protein J6590_034617 [Homalodisca vitripennis]|nr:hypothetical protein J6590_034617 [Homalodisca vitripennis]
MNEFMESNQAISYLQNQWTTIAVRVMVGLRARDPGVTDCTLSLYSRRVLYSRSKCALVRGGDVHHHETRGRVNFRVQQHRTNAFRNLPSQVDVRLINSLPERTTLVSKAFYSVDKFMMNRWDN